MRTPLRTRSLAQFLLPALLLCLGSCSWNGLRGSGVPATQTRETSAFQSIRLRGSGDVVARVGDATSVEVTCDDNLIEFVSTEIQDGVLVVGMQRGSYNFQSGLTVHVTSPELDAVSISGSGDLRVTGVHGQTFTASISGSGEVRADGNVGHVRAKVSGSGDIHLFDLRAHTADVSISGSGDIEVHAEHELAARVSGSGDVRYTGSPAVQPKISGSGSVHKLLSE